MCTKRVLVATKNGQARTQKGRIYDSKDALVKAAPGAFEPLEQWNVTHTVVEAATAAPGETRTVTKPPAVKKAAVKE
jgi:hypothetical protein